MTEASIENPVAQTEANFIGPKLITTTEELKAGLIHDFQGVPFENSRQQALEDFALLIDTPLRSIMQAVIFRRGENNPEYKAQSDSLENVLVSILRSPDANSDTPEEVSEALKDIRQELYSEEIKAKKIAEDEQKQKAAIEKFPGLGDLKPHQVAVDQDGINSDTLAYVGHLGPDTLRELHDKGVEDIYANPDDIYERVEFIDGITVGKSQRVKRIADLIRSGTKIDDNALSVIVADFVSNFSDDESLTLVSLNPKTIGRDFEEVRRRTELLGLDFVPIELAFQLKELFEIEHWELVASEDGETLYLGMEPSGKNRGVLLGYKDRTDGRFKIGQTWGYATGAHISERARVIFALKPKPQEKTQK